MIDSMNIIFLMREKLKNTKYKKSIVPSSPNRMKKKSN